MSHVKTDIVDD